MVYVYAVAEGLSDVDDLTGVQDEPLALVPFAPAVVVTGEVAERPPLDARALRDQDALVRALHARSRALLPMRFGTASGGRDEMLRALEAQPRLRERLEAVRGCEQMTTRVFGFAPSESGGLVAESGTAYLRGRAKRLQPPAVVAALGGAVGNLAKGTRVEGAAQPGVLGTIYHLVARGEDARYRAAMERAARDHDHLRVSITGPAPPYAFA